MVDIKLKLLTFITVGTTRSNRNSYAIGSSQQMTRHDSQLPVISPPLTNRPPVGPKMVPNDRNKN